MLPKKIYIFSNAFLFFCLTNACLTNSIFDFKSFQQQGYYVFNLGSSSFDYLLPTDYRLEKTLRTICIKIKIHGSRTRNSNSQIKTKGYKTLKSGKCLIKIIIPIIHPATSDWFPSTFIRLLSLSISTPTLGGWHKVYNDGQINNQEPFKISNFAPYTQNRTNLYVPMS